NDPDSRIDTIAWSTDFPYGVDWAIDKRDAKSPWSPIASLTSMTFFARKVEARDADGYLSLEANGFYRPYDDEASAPPRPEPDAAERTLFEQAEAAGHGKRWDEAAKAFAKLLETYRSDYVPWYDYACALARLGRADEAMAAL